MSGRITPLCRVRTSGGRIPGSGALELPKPSTLMHPSDYAELPELRCLYRGTLAGLPQRQSMELGEVESVMGLYLNVLLGAVKGRVRRLF